MEALKARPIATHKDTIIYREIGLSPVVQLDAVTETVINLSRLKEAYYNC
jgi:hypothetical protein